MWSKILRIAVVLVRCLAMIPPLLYGFAFVFSVLLLVLLPGRVKVVWSNLCKVYPKMGRCERSGLLLQHYWSLGQGVVEACLAWGMSDAWWQKRFQGSDLHLMAAPHPNGLLLLTPHLHTFEIMPRGFSVLGHPIGLVFHTNHEAQVDEAVRSFRSNYADCFNHTQVLSMRRWLKQGNILGVLPDQHMRGVDALKVPFMGVDAWTITGPLRLAKASHAKVLTVGCVRERFARSYRIILSDALAKGVTGDVMHDVSLMNQIFSEQIHQNPAQYYWLHRRFKSK